MSSKKSETGNDMPMSEEMVSYRSDLLHQTIETVLDSEYPNRAGQRLNNEQHFRIREWAGEMALRILGWKS